MKKMQMTFGYDDVTLVPAYSELSSRKESSTKFDIYELPIIASCMDTLGYDLMRCVTTNNIPFVAHRAFKSAEEQFNYFIPNNEFKAPFHVYQNIWWAVGSVQKYEEWITYLYDKGVRKFCVDMAHGDSKACVDTIKFIKNLDILRKEDTSRQPGKTLTSFGNHDIPVHIIAGNVATPEGFKRLEKAGANGIRIGIASGQICFTGDTLVTVCAKHKNGFYEKQIRHIKVGDHVVTASGRIREVKKVYENDYIGEIYKINDDIKVTPTHKFHVYDHMTKEKKYLEIKDYDEERYSFLDYDNRTHKAYLDIDEFNGKVYNLEVDDEHTYTVGKLMFGVSNCSTAIQTGFGVPILTNIIESVKVRKNKDTWIIADGGIKNTGDIAKAIYFGADFCMIGKLFAATDKACGRCYNKDFKLVPNDDLENIMYKEYHGMASRDARKNILSYASVEGVAGMIKYSGTTEDFINDTKLRLQASLSYAGAKNWKEFRKNTYPVMRSNAGIIAADTHLDITLDK
jgi:IMP dehydrogenase/GMP reductase